MSAGTNAWQTRRERSVRPPDVRIYVVIIALIITLLMPDKQKTYTDVWKIGQKLITLHRFSGGERLSCKDGTLWKDGRVVDCSGLENRRTERYRGFESLSFRRNEMTGIQGSLQNAHRSTVYQSITVLFSLCYGLTCLTLTSQPPALASSPHTSSPASH